MGGIIDKQNKTDVELDRSYEGAIKAFFDYDPNTGGVRWKEWVSPAWYKRDWYHDRFLRERAGKIVNFYKNRGGYLNIKVANRYTVYFHHIVWVSTYGKLPEHFIDHIDGNPINNAIENLRDVPQKMNNRNKKMRNDNSSGVTGVYWSKQRKKWFARVVVAGECNHLGLYDSVEDAAKARENFLSENKHLGFTNRHGG